MRETPTRYVHDNYEISKYRYLELYNFCLQYDEWKRLLASCYTVSSPVPHAERSGGVSDPTARAAMNAERYKKGIDLIEKCANAAAPEVAPYIIKCVTQGMTYEWLDVPMGRNQFYDARRKFFFLLDQNREK